LLRDENGNVWATGGTRLLSDFATGSHVLPLAVYCRVGRANITHVALIDTGATWTVLPRALIDGWAVQVDDLERSLRIESRFGSHSGTVVQLDLTLLAEPGRGGDLDVPGARAVVIDDWPGPMVIGFHGALEVIRIAIDPGVRTGEGMLYFGPVG
jgi:hypothetical protein